MTVIIDAGPLILLAQMQRLGLLAALFREVQVPIEVEREASATVTSLPPFLLSLDLPKATKVTLPHHLGSGERAVILAALAAPAIEWVILDDLSARTAALNLGLPVIGVAGLLLAAKERGLIDLVGPDIERALGFGYYLHLESVRPSSKAPGSPDGTAT